MSNVTRRLMNYLYSDYHRGFKYYSHDIYLTQRHLHKKIIPVMSESFQNSFVVGWKIANNELIVDVLNKKTLKPLELQAYDRDILEATKIVYIGVVKLLMPKTYKDMEKAYIKQYGINGIDDFSRLRLVMDSKKKIVVDLFNAPC